MDRSPRMQALPDPRKRHLAALLAVAAALPTQALAQTAPDAGRVLQQQAPPSLEAPRTSPDFKLGPPPSEPARPGGPTVTLSSVKIRGNTLFSEADLLSALGDTADTPYDMAGLRGLTDRLSAYYHERGYPFTRAYLPPQTLTGGELLIEVVEGRYGKIAARGEDESLVRRADVFLGSLKSGEVIESAALERATLLIDDLPGIKSVPVMRPGATLGAGDLDVDVEKSKPYAGEIGIDNQGNRYTGRWRARTNLDVNSPFLAGDQFTVRGLYTEENMWFGNVGYSLPISGDGLRANLGYGHTYYELGKNFSSLGATGTADVTTLGLSYPIIRSQRSNLSIAGAWNHKWLSDEQDAAGTDTDKSSDTFPIGLNFDTRDGFGGGGITYGNITWTPGHLDLDNSLAATDRTTARTEGQFHKATIDVARLQTVTPDLTLFARASGQWANKNLDSSEQFTLGGPYGVRAYPLGEGYGAQGWLTQVEMRYALGDFAPFAFYDAGAVKINKDTWSSGSNSRILSGYGLGLRYQTENWNAEAALAWRDRGGSPQSDTHDSLPVAWLNVAMKF